MKRRASHGELGRRVFCASCPEEITDRHYSTRRCKSCQTERNKKRDRKYHNTRYKKDPAFRKAASARALASYYERQKELE